MSFNSYHDARFEALRAGDTFERVFLDRMIGVIRWTSYDDEGEEMDRAIEVPLRWEVCPLCNGRGSHVDPNIDAGGLTREDFYDDPDFAESYHSGFYDVACYKCNGRTTTPVIDYNGLSPDKAELVKDFEETRAESLRPCPWEESERRMGC